MSHGFRALGNTPAGEALQDRRADRRERWKQKQVAYQEHEERTELEQEAAKLRLEARAVEAKAHALRKAVQDARIKPLVESLRSLDPTGRLRLLCELEPDISIDIVPRDLIPTQAKTHELPSTQREQLRNRIGTRKGAWADLQRLLSE